MSRNPLFAGTRVLTDALDRRERRRGVARAPRARLWGLEQLDLFREVPRHELEALLDRPSVASYRRRAQVIVDDDAVRVVVRGSLKLARVGVTGRKLIVALLEVGDVFGAITGEADLDDSYLVEALEASEVISLPRQAFATLLERQHFAYQVVQLLEDRQRQLVRRVEALAFKDVQTRLVETLLELATEHGEACAHGMAVDVRMSQQDLADLVGASRQMVNRILGELRRKLYVRRMGRVLCILNRDRLARLVDEAGELSTG